MLAAYGCKWYSTLEECVNLCLSTAHTYGPIPEHVEKYQELYPLYRQVYTQTKELNEALQVFRR